MAHDRHYAPVYHSAALLEAKVGNLEGLHTLHTQAKAIFVASAGKSKGRSEGFDVVARIEQLAHAVVHASADGALVDDEEDRFDSFLDGRPSKSLHNSSDFGDSFSYLFPSH